MKLQRGVRLIGIAIAAGCFGAQEGAAQFNVSAEVHAVVEWSLRSTKAYADAFNEVELDALVTAPDGTILRMPAFWAGEQTWKARYASGQVGIHRFRMECSDEANPTLQGVEGTIDIRPLPPGDLAKLTASRRHGPVRVATNRRHFEHANGTPFFWLADTWWMGLSQRLKWPEEFKALTADRVAKGFTVVQIVAGLYPDMPPFDERGKNEAGVPWTEDYARVNPAYFDAADRRIAWLAEAGLAPCIVGAWGYHLPWLGVERMKKHWRYLVARWGAYPVFWCLAGEGTMPYYLSEQKAQEREFQKKGWTEIAHYVRRMDPFHRPISIHPTDMARKHVEDPNVLDFDMLQTGHSDRASIPNTIKLVRASRAGTPLMPTINSEVCYEGILGTCFEEVQRFMAWSCLLSGAAGHTYGANGIWQVNRPGQPFGKSPHGGNWGDTPWDEAMRLPGSRQVGLAKQLLERFEWQRFEPHPDWAVWAEGTNFTTIPWGDWIWFPEGNPATDAPAESPRYFRKTFELGGLPVSGMLRLAVDDKFTLYVNRERVGERSGWKPHVEFKVADKLRKGRNVLAVRGQNAKGPPNANPAGLLCCLEVQLEGDKALAQGKKIEIVSDTSWRTSKKEEPGWMGIDFPDADWTNAMFVAKYGEGPWGQLGSLELDPFMVPYAAGLSGEVRVIYLPLTRPAKVQQLEAGVEYRASYFDPISGKSFPVGRAVLDGTGSWTAPRPPEEGRDWVLVLERAK